MALFGIMGFIVGLIGLGLHIESDAEENTPMGLLPYALLAVGIALCTIPIVIYIAENQ